MLRDYADIFVIVLWALLSISFFSNAYGQVVEIEEIDSGYLVDIRVDSLAFRQLSSGDSIPVLENATFIYEKGAPELPKLVKSFQLESDKLLKWQVISVNHEDIHANIAPSAGFVYQDQTDSERVKGSLYEQNAFYPAHKVDAFEPVITGDLTRQVFWFYPLQYNPAKNVLRVNRHIKIRIYAQPKQSFKSTIHKKSSHKSVEGEPTMLIIAPEKFQETLKTFTSWKKQLGIDILMVSADSLNSEQAVKEVVRNAYHTRDIDYLLLVGSHKSVPTSSSVFGPSDYAYGLLAGNDHYAEIPVGRFPAYSNLELENMIKKTIRYETASNDASWLTTYLGACSNEDGNNSGDKGESDFEHVLNLSKLYEQHEFTSSIILEGSHAEKSLSQLINQGSHYIFYTGHGILDSWSSTPFNTDSLNNLTNRDKHPIIINAACLIGNIQVPGNLAESFMRVSKDSMPLGSVAILSASIDQLWAPPMLGQDLIAQRLLNDKGTSDKTLGNVFLESYYGVMDNYGLGGTETVYTWLLFGDPSLRPWTGLPREMKGQIPGVFDVASDSFTVEGTDSARVTLVSSNQLIDSKIINKGKAKLSRGNHKFSDDVLVTLSKPGFSPVQSIVKPFSDGSSYYIIDDVIIDDDNNQLPENNEWIQIKPVVANYGLLTGKFIQGSIVLEDSTFEIKEPEVLLDSLAGNKKDTMPAFHVRTNSFFPDGYKTSFSVHLSDETGQRNSARFRIKINAPHIESPQISLNSGLFDPNQNNLVDTNFAEIGVILENSGHSEFKNCSIAIHAHHFLLDSIVGNYRLCNIKPLSSDTITFKMSIGENTPRGFRFYGNAVVEGFDSIPFNFHYQTIPSLTLGKSNRIEKEFPFYNYYKSNKTQVIYTAEEMENTPRLIDSIGFNIAAYSYSGFNRDFRNFSIQVGHTKRTAFPDSFVYTNSLKSVYDTDILTIPGKRGWIGFDIEDFKYNGYDNLFINIEWGLNPYTVNYNGAFSVYSHHTSSPRAAYGFSDQSSPPAFKGVSEMRPDIRFIEIPYHLNPVRFVYEAPEKRTENNIFINIGSSWIELENFIPTELLMPDGNYHYAISKDIQGEIIKSDSFMVSNGIQVVPVSFAETPFVHSIAEKKEEPYLSYMNGKLTVDGLTSEYTDIRVINLEGIIVEHFTSVANDTRLNLSGLRDGIYIIQVVDGTSFHTIKINTAMNYNQIHRF